MHVYRKLFDNDFRITIRYCVCSSMEVLPIQLCLLWNGYTSLYDTKRNGQRAGCRAMTFKPPDNAMESVESVR
jgi:hypothetical protein